MFKKKFNSKKICYNIKTFLFIIFLKYKTLINIKNKFKYNVKNHCLLLAKKNKQNFLLYNIIEYKKKFEKSQILFSILFFHNCYLMVF